MELVRNAVVENFDMVYCYSHFVIHVTCRYFKLCGVTKGQVGCTTPESARCK